VQLENEKNFGQSNTTNKEILDELEKVKSANKEYKDSLEQFRS